MDRYDLDYTALCGVCHGDGDLAEEACGGCSGDGTANRLRRIGGRAYVQLGEDVYGGTVSRSVMRAIDFETRFGGRSNQRIIEDAYADPRFEQGNQRLAWRFEQILAERVYDHVRGAPPLLQDPRSENLLHRYNTAEGVSNGKIGEMVEWYEDLSALAVRTVRPGNNPPLDIGTLRIHALSPPRPESDEHRENTFRGVLGDEGERTEAWYAELTDMVRTRETDTGTEAFW